MLGGSGDVLWPQGVCINSATGSYAFSFKRVEEGFDGFQNLVQLDRAALPAVKFNERDPFVFANADVVAIRFWHEGSLGSADSQIASMLEWVNSLIEQRSA